MRRDWAEYRRCLALPNSAHSEAGLFSLLLWNLNCLDRKPNRPTEAYRGCHDMLLTGLFSARSGVLTDTKRRCMWALNVDSVQLPAASSLPPGVDHVRCINTHGPTWTFSHLGAPLALNFDIRTPRGRLEILNVVSRVEKPCRKQGPRAKATKRRPLRERTLLQNARHAEGAMETDTKRGRAFSKTLGEGARDEGITRSAPEG